MASTKVVALLECSRNWSLSSLFSSEYKVHVGKSLSVRPSLRRDDYSLTTYAQEQPQYETIQLRGNDDNLAAMKGIACIMIHA